MQKPLQSQLFCTPSVSCQDAMPFGSNVLPHAENTSAPPWTTRLDLPCASGHAVMAFLWSPCACKIASLPGLTRLLFCALLANLGRHNLGHCLANKQARGSSFVYMHGTASVPASLVEAASGIIVTEVPFAPPTICQPNFSPSVSWSPARICAC